MAESGQHFIKPAATDRLFNRLFGFLVRAGIGFGHNFILEVRGRKSGRLFTTPVNVLDHKGKRYLVASRGETQWARNARATGRVALVKGSQRLDYTVSEVPVNQRAELIKEFLERYAGSVQRYHTVKAGAPVSEFEATAHLHPVFELTPIAR